MVSDFLPNVVKDILDTILEEMENQFGLHILKTICAFQGVFFSF